jgi:hypothetical protein
MQHSVATRTRCATFIKNSRCSEKDSGIREQIPELRVLSTFIPKAGNRYLKNFSPAATWQLFSYEHRQCFLPFCLRYMPFYMTMLRILFVPLIFLWREHSIREAWEQPTGGLGHSHPRITSCFYIRPSFSQSD